MVAIVTKKAARAAFFIFRILTVCSQIQAFAVTEAALQSRLEKSFMQEHCR
jgi:hypothetical protein